VATPSADRIAVALTALRADADMWSGMAGRLTAAGGAGAALGPSRAEFSAPGAELAQVYARLQAQLVRLLGEAAANCTAVADALAASADAYEAEEAAGVHRARGVY
jgi:hypothetical protein